MSTQTAGRPIARTRGLAVAALLAPWAVFSIAGALIASAQAHEAKPSRTAAANAQFTVQTQRHVVPPELVLTRMDGRSTSLRRELEAAEPVIVNFVFTTCSTICSTQTATLAALQRQLRDAARPARFMSFTIDPDNDTPEVLTKFARQFSVGPGWDFYTGKFDDLLRQQQAFDVYRGSKVSHPPVVMMRRTRSSPWVRVEGHPSPDELRRVYEQLPSS